MEQEQSPIESSPKEPHIGAVVPTVYTKGFQPWSVKLFSSQVLFVT